MEPFWLIGYFFVLFLFLGSFLNVVAFRTLEGQTVLDPKHSHCPHCQTRLTWRDLIPVLSWVLLRGRCRTCQTPISKLYPMGEGTAALVLTFVVVHGGLMWETLVIVVLFLFLLAVTLTDLRAKLMPNKITYPGLVAILFLRLLIHPQPLWVYLAGFLLGGAVLTLLALVPNGMGGGDIKLFALIGLGLGWDAVLFALFLSCVWGTVIGLPLKWAGKIKPRQSIAFGPFILLGTLSAWAYGQDIWQWYMHLY
ncbi:MAG TPA: A24 family peptidase [Bacilli bacterium]|nr:A24 family peptidase [Bacilli bacterium]